MNGAANGRQDGLLRVAQSSGAVPRALASRFSQRSNPPDVFVDLDNHSGWLLACAGARRASP